MMRWSLKTVQVAAEKLPVSCASYVPNVWTSTGFSGCSRRPRWPRSRRTRMRTCRSRRRSSLARLRSAPRPADRRSGWAPRRAGSPAWSARSRCRDRPAAARRRWSRTAATPRRRPGARRARDGIAVAQGAVKRYGPRASCAGRFTGTSSVWMFADRSSATLPAKKERSRPAPRHSQADVDVDVPRPIDRVVETDADRELLPGSANPGVGATSTTCTSSGRTVTEAVTARWPPARAHRWRSPRRRTAPGRRRSDRW